jgi:GAF domain-containing protein
VSGALARRAMEEGRGFIWRRALTTTGSDSMVKHRIATGVYVPLRWPGQTLGVVCVDSPSIAAMFTHDDLRLLMAVAQYTALAVISQQAQEPSRYAEELGAPGSVPL